MLRLLLAVITVSASAAHADTPAVASYHASLGPAGWTFSVTIQHDDTGWDHYADAWRILDSNDNVLGARSLVHPHEGQPSLTRSISGVQIPDGVTSVFIQTHDNKDGWGQSMTPVTLR
jgi:hypothetical protein